VPDPWSFNPWNLSLWGADPARDAARDTARMGGGEVATSLAEVLMPPVPAKDPDDYDPADWFARLSEDWPTVANVIPAEKQVTSRDNNTVLDWVNKSLAQDKQRTELQCFHFAKYQMYVADYDISGPPAIDSDSILVIREYHQQGAENISELQLIEAVRAVTYIKDSLVAGIPVMIGVKLSDYPDEPNNIWKTPYVIATDHFVVAVGMGLEGNTPYVNIYDYLNVHTDSDRLYLTPLLILESETIGYRMIEMRESYPR
jgi:hypothetical protein